MSNTVAIDRRDFFCKPYILSEAVVLLIYFLLDSTNAAMSFYDINETIFQNRQYGQGELGQQKCKGTFV